jgi:hypothetical protein
MIINSLNEFPPHFVRFLAISANHVLLIADIKLRERP